MSTSKKPTGTNIPSPPPLPSKSLSRIKFHRQLNKETKDFWDRIFKQAYDADVYILTEDKSCLPAHSSVLGNASPMIKSAIQRSQVKNGIKHLTIKGVPYPAVYAFVRYLYSSCYEEGEMKKYVVHLLVLSHCYSIPSLKRLCMSVMEEGWMDRENVIDMLQLARGCDAPRLAFICVRLIVRDFKAIASTQGWKAMKQANLELEQELLESMVEVDSRKQDRLKKLEEKKLFLHLVEAMEALVHICKDGCTTIGPRDKVLKGSHGGCGFAACKGVETLIRHFSGCKTRVPGGCVGCKRMWQLFELHARLCNHPDSCKVPLCRHFNIKMQQERKKGDAKWKVLVSKVIAAKNSLELFKARPSSVL